MYVEVNVPTNESWQGSWQGSKQGVIAYKHSIYIRLMSSLSYDMPVPL